MKIQIFALKFLYIYFRIYFQTCFSKFLQKRKYWISSGSSSNWNSDSVETRETKKSRNSSLLHCLSSLSYQSDLPLPPMSSANKMVKYVVNIFDYVHFAEMFSLFKFLQLNKKSNIRWRRQLCKMTMMIKLKFQLWFDLNLI